MKYNDFTCCTGELPWKDNKTSISCIPIGEYLCMPYSSAKYPNVYEVTNVPNRKYILIHQGNYCGDISKGYKSDVNGCILVGDRIGMLNKQLSILNSKNTLNKFKSIMGNNPFKLVIRNL